MDKDKLEGMWKDAKEKVEEKVEEWKSDVGKKDVGKKAEDIPDQLKDKTQQPASELKESAEQKGDEEEEERRSA